MLRVNARWGSKQTSEGRGGTEATRGAPGLDGVTPVKAQNVKRGTECLGKQEFFLPSSYRRMEGDETNLEGKDHKVWNVWVMLRSSDLVLRTQGSVQGLFVFLTRPGLF